MMLFLFLAIFITSLLLLYCGHRFIKFESQYQYMITCYGVSYREYMELQKYYQTFPALNIPAFDRMELFILGNTKAAYSLNRCTDKESVAASFIQNTAFSRKQIDVFISNVDSVGKCLVPLQRSDDEVYIIFIERI